MTDEAALLAAILADPADDTVRLAYADWLEEHGAAPERAAFIRTQCGRDADVRTMELWRYLHNSKGWFVGVCKALCVEWDDWGVRTDRSVIWENKYCSNTFTARRGFVSEVTCTAAGWLALADALCWHPMQTVECPQCLGDGWNVRLWMGTPDAGCPLCRKGLGWRGTGRVPRPLPSTAQPVARVTLTDMPTVAGTAYGTAWLPGHQATVLPCRPTDNPSPELTRSLAEQLLAILWPGIAFGLPT